ILPPQTIVVCKKSTVLAYLYRAGDTCAELIHNILALDMRSGRVRMVNWWMWYRGVCRCRGREMTGGTLPKQVTDWPKAAYAPRR
ncbi:hypothetical protein BGY98DRAFT_1011108, partial [Russula aff. rugulosa BPL654]